MVEILPNGTVRFAFLRRTDETVYLVGDFNNWDEGGTPMSRGPDGTHLAELSLKPGEYEYKFKVGQLWFNDDFASKYVPNPWGSENSVAIVPDGNGRGFPSQQASGPPP